jgi:hypothetical protein
MNLCSGSYSGKRRHDKKLILAVILCCFFIRRGIFPQLINKYKFIHKSAYWQRGVDGWLPIAKNLISGNGYRMRSDEITAARGPVYPFYLAFILWLFGLERGISIALSMQMVLDTITCWLIWKLALKLFRCRYTALLAAFMWALYPPAMVLDLFFYSEPLFTLILCLFNLNMLFLMNNLSRLRFLSGGILLGLATLCRPITLYFPLLLILTWIFHRRFRRIWSGALVFLFGFCLVLSPWVIRNYLQFKEFIPTGTLLGPVWYYGLVRMESPDYLKLDEFYGQEKARREFASRGINLREKNEAERDRILSRAAWTMIKRYPFRYLAICLNRLSTIWFKIDARTYSTPKDWAVFLLNAPIIILSLSTFIFFRGQWSCISFPIVLLILYHTLSCMLVHGTWRLSVPMMPYMIIFSAYALVRTRFLLWPRGGEVHQSTLN